MTSIHITPYETFETFAQLDNALKSVLQLDEERDDHMEFYYDKIHELDVNQKVAIYMDYNNNSNTHSSHWDPLKLDLKTYEDEYRPIIDYDFDDYGRAKVENELDGDTFDAIDNVISSGDWEEIGERLMDDDENYSYIIVKDEGYVFEH